MRTKVNVCQENCIKIIADRVGFDYDTVKALIIARGIRCYIDEGQLKTENLEITPQDL